MTLKQLQRFVAAVNALPEERRRAVELAFHNPTDAAVAVFELFGEDADRFIELVDTSRDLGVTNAERIADLVLEHCNATNDMDGRDER
jgi:hypothetical protein